MNNEASIILKVLDKASGPLRAIGRSFQSMSKTSRESLKQAATVAAGMGVALAGAAVGAGGYAAKQAADMESALGEVSSVGVSDLDGLRQAAMAFSNQWSGTTGPDFVRAAYDIKSGISSLSDEGVAEFTRLAGVTAKATKSTTAEMTSLFASGFGIYREQFKNISDMEFGQLFSAGIAKAVKDYKTTGPKMQEAIQTLGASATKSLVPMEEQLAVLGMLQQTMGGSEAGTKYKAFLKDVAKAGGELGLPFLDANKKLKSMPEVLDLLRKKYGDTIDEIEAHEIQKAFGSEEGVALIKLLYSQTDALRDNAKNMGQAMKGGTALTEEMAQAMNQGLGEQTKLLGQQFNNLAQVVGEELAPTLKPLLKGLGQGLVAMQAWVKENPGVAKGVLIFAGALGVVAAALGTAAAAMTVMNLAVLANPVTWAVAGVIAGLAALVAAGAWMVANWDKVKVWWTAFWGEYGNAVIVAMGVITGPLGGLAAAAGLIINNWEKVSAFFSNLWGNVLAAWDTGSWVDAGVALVQGLWDGMIGLMDRVSGWVGDKVRGLFDWLPDWAKAQLGIKPTAPPEAASAGGAPGPQPPGAPVLAAATPDMPGYPARGAAAPVVAQGPAPMGAAQVAAQGGTQGRITAVQALGQPQKSQVDGKVVVEIKNAPPGARITQVEENGNSGLNLQAGLTLGMGY